MSDNIDKQLDVSMNNCINGLINDFEKMNLSTEQIYEYINKFSEFVRAKMHLYAITSGNEELAKKICKANERLKKERIDKFLDSIKNEKNDEFLANMSFTDKSSLKVDIQHSNDLNFSSLEVEKSLEILETSIYSDLNKFAKAEGFDSVEAWQRSNASKDNNKPFHVRRSRF